MNWEKGRRKKNGRRYETDILVKEERNYIYWSAHSSKYIGRGNYNNKNR
jgi:hypothetical protein